MSTFSLQSLTDPEESVERKPVPFSQIEVLPAQDPLLEFFASRLMWRGKRARAEKVTSEILLHINALTKAPPLPVLRQAVDFAAPAVRVVSHKRGGKMIEKPMALNERQRMRRGIDWILGESDKRPGYTRGERIARECIRIIQGSSSVLETKEKEHKRAMICRRVHVQYCMYCELVVDCDSLQRKYPSDFLDSGCCIYILMLIFIQLYHWHLSL
jgi:small subunit ribosomal protein S7